MDPVAHAAHHDAAASPAPAPAAAAKAQTGDTQHVKGINDWEGDITGKPAANSKFTKLQIGMGMRQVTDLVGQPTDQGAYITGKAFIPFFFGGDRIATSSCTKARAA